MGDGIRCHHKFKTIESSQKIIRNKFTPPLDTMDFSVFREHVQDNTAEKRSCSSRRVKDRNAVVEKSLATIELRFQKVGYRVDDKVNSGCRCIVNATTLLLFMFI